MPNSEKIQKNEAIDPKIQQSQSTSVKIPQISSLEIDKNKDYEQMITEWKKKNLDAVELYVQEMLKGNGDKKDLITAYQTIQESSLNKLEEKYKAISGSDEQKKQVESFHIWKKHMLKGLDERVDAIAKIEGWTPEETAKFKELRRQTIKENYIQLIDLCTDSKWIKNSEERFAKFNEVFAEGFDRQEREFENWKKNQKVSERNVLPEQPNKKEPEKNQIPNVPSSSPSSPSSPDKKIPTDNPLGQKLSIKDRAKQLQDEFNKTRNTKAYQDTKGQLEKMNKNKGHVKKNG